MSVPNDISKDSFLINENNLKTGVVHSQYRSIYEGSFWHKIYVQNATQCKRNDVLKTLMKTVHPLDFIPVHYTLEDDNVCFLLKNCGAAITELCKMNLTVPNPDPKALQPFKIAILLKYAHAADLKIDIQATIAQILKKRFNSTTKTLNLDSFSKDPSLIEFCPLSQPKLMYFVLHLSRDFQFEKLQLSKNEIELLKPLEVLSAAALKNFVCLDLRRNNIKSFDELIILKKFAIQELLLDENPICENISEYDYIAAVKEYCPKLLKLDGFKLPPEGMPSLRRTYLCNRNGQALVDQFLEHYITIYDSIHRNVLESIYHPNAVFSITAVHLLGHSTSSNLNVFDYKKISRNIISITDYSRCTDYVYVGPSDIIAVLNRLPRSKHDQFSFTVDLTYYSEATVVFTLTGMFREDSEHFLQEEKLYGFTRTFVLVKVLGNEYSISNDMLHISNATSSQHQRAFRVTKIPMPFYVKVPTPQTDAQKVDMVDGVSKITNLRHDWAKKLLQDCDYDLKESLNLFIHLFKADKLPSRAFLSFDSYEDDPAVESQNVVSSNPNIIQGNSNILLNNVPKVGPPPPPCISNTDKRISFGFRKGPRKQSNSNNTTIIMKDHKVPIAFVDIEKETEVKFYGTSKKNIEMPESVALKEPSETQINTEEQDIQQSRPGQLLDESQHIEQQEEIQEQLEVQKHTQEMLEPQIVVEEKNKKQKQPSMSGNEQKSSSAKEPNQNPYAGISIYGTLQEMISSVKNLQRLKSPASVKKELRKVAASCLVLNGSINTIRKLIDGFYAHNLVDEARIYFKQHEKRYSNSIKTFHLYTTTLENELKLKNYNEAESMFDLLMKYHLQKTVTYALNRLLKLNEPNFVEKMCGKLMSSDIPHGRKRDLFFVMQTNCDIPKQQQEKYSRDFLDFRKKLLVKVGILPETNDDSLATLDLKGLMSQSIETINKNLFTNNQSNYAILRALLLSFQRRFNATELTEFLDAHVDVDHILREDLKIVYQIKQCEKDGAPDEAMNLLKETVTSGRNCMNIFEELNGYQISLRYYKHILELKQPVERMFIISLLFMTFTKKFGMVKQYENALEMANKCGIIEDFFHPDDVLKCKKIKLFRDWYTKQPKGQLTDQQIILFCESNVSGDARSEALRACLYHDIPNLAKTLKHQFKIKNTQVEHNRYKISVAVAHANFGSKASATDILRNLQPHNVSTALAEIEVGLKMTTIKHDLINSKIHELISTFPLNITPAFLETLHKYQHSWQEHINIVD